MKQQEDTTVLNIYVPDNITLKHKKINRAKLFLKADRLAIIAGYLNLSPSVTKRTARRIQASAGV